MGRKEKAKAARKFGHPYNDTRHGDSSRNEASIQNTQSRTEHPPLQLSTNIDPLSYPSCQAIVEHKRSIKCGLHIHLGCAKWCSYHAQMRFNLCASFHELLKEYRGMAMALPDMALVQESVDLDWLRGIVEPLRARSEVLSRCLLNRVCFMERMQGDDLSFGTKNAAKDLKNARTRLYSHLRTIEQRMLTLILCTYEDQTPVAAFSAQFLGRVDKNQRCAHHAKDPERDFSNGPLFPVARRYHQQVEAKGVVDAYIETELVRLRRQLLAKMGIQIIQLANEDTVLVTHWDSLVDHERAHIAAAYFRRVIFNESHLFVQSHFHTHAFKAHDISLPSIINREGDKLDLVDEIDNSLLCMITFILSPQLRITHLELLRDYIIWPAHLEVRTAVQDVVLDIVAFQEVNKAPSRPYWAHPIRRDVFNSRFGDPEGTLPLLRGTLYEVAYLHATRDDTLESKFWPHIASLIRCGKCLFATVQSADEWCDLVRTLSVYRVPLYARLFPQIVGSPVGDLWTSDRVPIEIHGQPDESLGNETPCRYRLDEVLEMAGITMLGIIEGGPVDTKGVTDPKTARFMQKFLLFPQLWFFLPTYDPIVHAFLHELVERSHAADAAFTFNTVTEDEAITEVLRNARPLANALQLPPNSHRWTPVELSLGDLHLLTRTQYDPLPRRIVDDSILVHIATKSFPPTTGVQTILELLLEISIRVNRVDSRATLEQHLEHTLEWKYGMVHRDRDSKFSYRFCPARVMPMSSEPELEHGVDLEAPSQGSQFVLDVPLECSPPPQGPSPTSISAVDTPTLTRDGGSGCDTWLWTGTRDYLGTLSTLVCSPYYRSPPIQRAPSSGSKTFDRLTRGAVEWNT